MDNTNFTDRKNNSKESKKQSKEEARRREREIKKGHLKGDFCQPNDPRIDF